MPPKLYDLTTLQRDANRLFGMNAGATLRCAQTLYENKLITYPRTDSCYLTEDMEQTASDVLRACLLVYPFLSVSNAEEKHEPPGSGPLDPLRASRPDITRILDSKKVTDHHAIIPTMVIEKTDLSTLGNEEKTIPAMISARLACAVGTKYMYESVRATFLCCGYPFTATGRSIKKLISEYGFDEEDAEWTAEAVHRVNRMSMDDAEEAGYESLFFWDDDCLLFFDGAEYFIDSIHQITSGAGAAMGYGYEDVTKIFTDAGYQLPLWLVGTEAAFDAREESLRERLKDLQDQINPEQDSPIPEST